MHFINFNSYSRLYSFLRRLSINLINGLFFGPVVSEEDVKIKYGFIELQRLYIR